MKPDSHWVWAAYNYFCQLSRDRVELCMSVYSNSADSIGAQQVIHENRLLPFLPHKTAAYIG